MFNIIKTANYEEMSHEAALFIAKAISERPNIVLGLATGSTPVGTYKLLTERHERGLDFSRVCSVNLDEYVGLPGDHEQSYLRFMRENLFDHINIQLSNVNIPNGMAVDVDAECAAYDRLVESLGGIDLQLLGVGPNGHIGFNEPGESFLLNTHKVTLTESTRQANMRFFDSLDEVPTHAITLGIRGIFTARSILLLASGEGKAEAMKGLLSQTVTPQLQASILALHRRVTIIADEAALSLCRI